jgi:hypothetical protein
MNWDALARFIRDEDPALAASLRGVRPAEVELIEANYRIRLPETYRRFLYTMGEESDGLTLFAPERNQRFGDLVAQLPSRIYPRDRYFKIAFAEDSSSEISPDDYFLDLARSDGIDAPVVAFQDVADAEIEEFNPAAVRERPFTFSEQAANSFFTVLVLDRTAHATTLAVGPFDRPAASAGVADALRKMGFRPVLPPDKRVITLRRGTLGALVNVWDLDRRGVTIALGGNDDVELRVVFDQLLTVFPDAVAQNDRDGAGF